MASGFHGDVAHPSSDVFGEAFAEGNFDLFHRPLLVLRSKDDAARRHRHLAYDALVFNEHAVEIGHAPR